MREQFFWCHCLFPCLALLTVTDVEAAFSS